MSSGAIRHLSIDLNLISEWSDKWQLSMSVEKCCVLHLCRTNPRHVYMLSDQQLQVCSLVKLKIYE